jgi:hypothetical protein
MNKLHIQIIRIQNKIDCALKRSDTTYNVITKEICRHNTVETYYNSRTGVVLM